MGKELVEGLGTRLFITVTKHAPHYCGWRKILARNFFLIMQGLTPLATEVRKLLVSLDIGRHNALEIFAVKRNIVSEISKV